MLSISNIQAIRLILIVVFINTSRHVSSMALSIIKCQSQSYSGMTPTSNEIETTLWVYWMILYKRKGKALAGCSGYYYFFDISRAISLYWRVYYSPPMRIVHTVTASEVFSFANQCKPSKWIESYKKLPDDIETVLQSNTISKLLLESPVKYFIFLWKKLAVSEDKRLSIW